MSASGRKPSALVARAVGRLVRRGHLAVLGHRARRRPVSAPVEEEPYDYVPLDAYGAAPVEAVDDLPPIDVPDGMGSAPAGAPADASALWC